MLTCSAFLSKTVQLLNSSYHSRIRSNLKRHHENNNQLNNNNNMLISTHFKIEK